jgi:hypothetical protein
LFNDKSGNKEGGHRQQERTPNEFVIYVAHGDAKFRDSVTVGMAEN